MMTNQRSWRSLLMLTWMFSAALSQVVVEQNDQETAEKNHHSPKSGFVDAVEAIATSAGSIWNDDVIESAVSMRRAVRSVGRQARDLSSIFYPVVSSLSALAQVVSYLPGVMRMLVTGVSGAVEVMGGGIVMLGTGVDYSATALETVGRSVQTLSASVPTLVTVLVFGGGILLALYPGLQDAVFSSIASLGLILAGKAAAGARNFVDENSFWSTLLQTLELFTLKARQDF